VFSLLFFSGILFFVVKLFLVSWWLHFMAEGTANPVANNVVQESLDFIVNNPSHVLFLHPSDNPNNVLVSELMNGENYAHWRKAMEVALIAKNKLGFVLGDCTRPLPLSPLAGQWDRCDKMVISWLLNAVIKDIGQSILFSSTAGMPGCNLKEDLERLIVQNSLEFKGIYA